MNFTDFQVGVDSRLQDSAGKLVQRDKDDAIGQAIKARYSKDRPREIVTDVAGSGTALLALPAGPSGETFEDGFSRVTQIEYPIGDVPPTYIEQDSWQQYRTPTGLKILLIGTTPNNGDQLRVTWTVRHTPGTGGNQPTASTAPDADFEAICDFAASLCLTKIATIFAGTRDSSIAADAVNYRTKSQEYLGLAKEMRTRYFDHIGIVEAGGSGKGGGGTSDAAWSGGDMELRQGSGVERMTHKRR